MRWPRLVVPFARSTDAVAQADCDGIDEDGAPIEGARWSGRCNWQDATVERFGRMQAETEVRARLYIDGDAFPSVAIIAGGTVRAFGEERSIVSGRKARNPDGTVNHTVLELK